MINKILKEKGLKIILGSQSPRRKELLSQIIEKYDVRVSDVEESFPQNYKRNKISSYLSEKKAIALKDTLKENEILICSDTIVWKNKPYNKPLDREDAIRILKDLSGKKHLVITSVTILSQNKKRTFYDTTTVTFKNFQKTEIDFYIDKYKPYDKAGAYGIQEWIGYVGIKKISGDYNNVMGFPLYKLYKNLTKFIE